MHHRGTVASLDSQDALRERHSIQEQAGDHVGSGCSIYRYLQLTAFLGAGRGVRNVGTLSAHGKAFKTAGMTCV